MDTRLLIGIVVLAAVILVSVIGVAVYLSRRRLPEYSDEKLTALIRMSRAEAGEDPDAIEIVKIVEIEKENSSGRSVYDVKIKFISGEHVGKVVNFRYHLLMMGKSGKPIVEKVVGAPKGSPVEKD